MFSHRRRLGILLICSMSLFIVGLDITAVNVALPSIASGLDASVAGLQWTVSAYTLAMASLLLFSVAMSIVTNTFTDPRERAQAVGVWGAVFGISMALGPIVGGALVSTAGWEWIFLINVRVWLAAIALTLRFVPESRAPSPRRFDPAGQALVIALLASVTYGIIEAPALGGRPRASCRRSRSRRWRCSACCSTSRAARSR